MLISADIDPSQIYEDRTIVHKDDGPGLNACLKALEPGNTLVVWKPDRLGRDLKHLVTTVEELRSRNVGLKILTGAGAQIDTTTATTPKTNPAEVARRLDITTTTLYACVNGDGTLKQMEQKILIKT
ncbi:recombinase family protein [Undibacterium sp. TC4M20W]|uniref:recombinase family protein n=1 Tax=unclassified Undibacterium TaxID=2630295 RepID=UPI003BF23F58